jgi:hypothetical protein
MASVGVLFLRTSILDVHFQCCAASYIENCLSIIENETVQSSQLKEKVNNLTYLRPPRAEIQLSRHCHLEPLAGEGEGDL